MHIEMALSGLFFVSGRTIAMGEPVGPHPGRLSISTGLTQSFVLESRTFRLEIVP
ncbi:Hypothetical protein NGAL_HAMBI1146_08720 [Neorhizobium galegae bv. officinalis]|nr:Hypothetical protein NGAL_HAMBI1146_08720 [Neorhizobium galegae bv. officinalis]